jgi:cobalt-zinc-cadmium resistance protein CzcA
VHALRIPGTSLTAGAIEMQHTLERKLQGPSRRDRLRLRPIGTAEIATDPMPPNVADTYVMLKPRERVARSDDPRPSSWRPSRSEPSPRSPGNNYEFSQPIEMRFNELIAGVRSDVAVKVFGDDLEVLLGQGDEIAKALLEAWSGAPT